MRTRPEIFRWMGLFLFGVGLSIPIQISFIYGHTPLETVAILIKLAPINLLVMALSFVCGWLSLHASPWIKVAVPICIMAVFWNNWIVGTLQLNFSTFQAWSASVGFLLINGLWYHPDARKILQNPSLRWWKTPNRKRMRLPVFLDTHIEDSIKAKTFDISESGVFVAIESDWFSHSKGLQSLRIGRRIGLKLILNPINVIQCEAEVVRMTEAKGDYPAGIGLRFVEFQGTGKNEIQNFAAAA